MTKYQVVRGWFKGHLHFIYGDKWFRKMQSGKRCKIAKGKSS